MATTKAELIEKVANEAKETLGLTKKAATEVATKLLETIVTSLVAGETVSLHGLGKFETRVKTHRIYPGIKPGEKRDASAGQKVTRRHLVFRPARDLKLALNASTESAPTPAA